MVFSRRTIRIVPMFVGTLLLLSSAHMPGQQYSQNSNQQAPAANGQNQVPPPSSSQNQASDQKPGSQKSSSAQSSGRQSGNQAQSSSGAGSATAPAPNGSSAGNPFPMAQSEAAAKADEQKRQGNGKPSASEANPFPEAQSKAAAKDNGNGNAEKSNAGSSSSNGGYSSSDANLPPPDVGEGKPGNVKGMDTYTRDHTLVGRVEDDLNVADFYMKNGNYRGSFLRYQDALQYDPQNDTAQYGIAEAMCKENVTNKAIAHFKSYVKNNPKGKYIQKAEDRLAHPEKCQNNH